MLVAVNELRDVACAALVRAGVPLGHAERQGDLFLEAEMRGLPSHGMLRLPRVVERIRAGLTNPYATGEAQWVSEAFLRVDGQRGMGPVVAMAAIDAIAARARRTGIALAAITNTNHLGALAYYVEKAAEQDIVCIGLTISEALVHPHGGRQALLGTNPIAIGVPADPAPMILDMATSLVSMGKIHDYAARGQPIPEGWALDRDGEPTTNAEAAKSGAIAPFGGAKGYALGVALEVLVASLTCSAVGTAVGGTLDSTNVSNKGDVFIAISSEAAAGRAIASQYLETLRNAAPSRPGTPVMAPGDRAREARRRAQVHGVEIEDGLWAQLQDLTKA